jgi:hypothetical protein
MPWKDYSDVLEKYGACLETGDQKWIESKGDSAAQEAFKESPEYLHWFSSIETDLESCPAFPL